MYLLMETCQHPGVLKTIYFIKILVDVIFIIVPIMLIILLLIDFSKAVISGDSENNKKNNKLVIGRIVSAIVIFAIPWIVNTFLLMLSSAGFSSDYSVCLNNANKDSIDYYQILYDEEQRLLREKMNSSGNKNQSDGIYANLADKMVSVALSEVGTSEGNNNDNKYGRDLKANNAPWCAIFVTWVAKHTTVNNVNLFDDVIAKNGSHTTFASTTGNIMFFNSQNNLEFHPASQYGGNYIPKKGDYIFFDWDNVWNKKMDYNSIYAAAEHTGMVEKANNQRVYTIEGNSDDKVSKREYPLNSKSIIGYGSWY